MNLHTNGNLIAAGDTITCPTVFSWSPDNAAEVTMDTECAGYGVTWAFARDLLLDGLTQSVGEGDVHVYPSDDEEMLTVYVTVSSPEGMALLSFSALDLAGWLCGTLAAVPSGAEVYDVDAWITGLLEA